MLSGPSQALTKLLRGEGVEGKGRITNSSRDMKTLRNGIRYFSVEVSFEDGVQYGITAYDEEAVELYKVALGSQMIWEKKEIESKPILLVSA